MCRNRSQTKTESQGTQQAPRLLWIPSLHHVQSIETQVEKMSRVNRDVTQQKIDPITSDKMTRRISRASLQRREQLISEA